IFATNRFTIYAMYPDCNISIHVLWGLKRQNTAFAIGKSIVNRSSRTDVGALCLKYDGGGHRNAGTCQVEIAESRRVLDELISSITADG
ncbi:MAG: exopolyphosphatase, partial [Xanthomonadales bacterium]|nr:exopolyphosphatase [Xanthomonadales bacterium]